MYFFVIDYHCNQDFKPGTSSQSLKQPKLSYFALLYWKLLQDNNVYTKNGKERRATNLQLQWGEKELSNRWFCIVLMISVKYEFIIKWRNLKEYSCYQRHVITADAQSLKRLHSSIFSAAHSAALHFISV